MDEKWAQSVGVPPYGFSAAIGRRNTSKASFRWSGRAAFKYASLKAIPSRDIANLNTRSLSVLVVEVGKRPSRNSPSNRLSTLIPRKSAICNSRPALIRFVPFSYFCICWKLRPKWSASWSWLMPINSRRRRTLFPTCLSMTSAAPFGPRLCGISVLSGDSWQTELCRRAIRPEQEGDEDHERCADLQASARYNRTVRAPGSPGHSQQHTELPSDHAPHQARQAAARSSLSQSEEPSWCRKGGNTEGLCSGRSGRDCQARVAEQLSENLSVKADPVYRASHAKGLEGLQDCNSMP